VLLWHAGATVAITRFVFQDPKMDLRFLLLGAVLPDLIDTPIGLAWWPIFDTVRLSAHSLLFATVVMVGVLATTRRGRPRRRWMAVAVGVLLHLVLDAMWRQQETLWWPLFGVDFAASGFATVGAYLRWLFTNPIMWAGEGLGLAYLGVLAWRSELTDKEARNEFLTTGRVRAPIGR
jgi:membrane-bound metal-dependent hydrolase YbcI (DUF457 family)